MPFEIMTSEQLATVARMWTIDVDSLAQDLKDLRELACMAALTADGVELPKPVRGNIGFLIAPEEQDVLAAPAWPLRARSRRIKAALTQMPPVGPGLEVGLVKDQKGDCYVNEGGQKSPQGRVVIRESGLEKLVAWFRGLPEDQRTALETSVNAAMGLTEGKAEAKAVEEGDKAQAEANADEDTGKREEERQPAHSGGRSR